MDKLIDINAYPVRATLKILLQDKTTKQNIIWATDDYKESMGYKASDHIELSHMVGMDPVLLQPRISKALKDQQERTRLKAEVFTPSWICNQMNNHLDEEWFGRKNVFNIEQEQSWIPVETPITFPEKKDWKKYIDSRRLEITCGEAPYLISRYDASTGEYIADLNRRIGLLDRKLRIVNENTADYKEWAEWTLRAFQSCYGFEYQGDSLLIGRINLIITFYEYHVERWTKEPDEQALRKIANVIAWNLWQMDGYTDAVPLGRPQETEHQINMFEFLSEEDSTDTKEAPLCRIYNWRSDTSVIYKTLKG